MYTVWSGAVTEFKAVLDFKPSHPHSLSMTVSPMTTVFPFWLPLKGCSESGLHLIRLRMVYSTLHPHALMTQ